MSKPMNVPETYLNVFVWVDSKLTFKRRIYSANVAKLKRIQSKIEERSEFHVELRGASNDN